MSYNNQYIITNISESNGQYDKAPGIDQIPVGLAFNGVPTIRENITGYRIIVGK